MKSPALIASIVFVLAGSFLAGQDASPAKPSLLKTSFGKLPIYFIENRGLYPEEVKFYIQGADKTLFFTSQGITFRLKGIDHDWVVKLEFVGANPDVIPRGEDKQQAVFSYFKGSEKDWKTGLKTYAKVVYEELWPGIDLVYRGTVNKLKYEFIVAPGADPKKVRLRYQGVDKLTITKEGALRVSTPEGGFEDAPPAAWQDVDGKRVPVTMLYTLAVGGEFVFDLGNYDNTRPLVLDPAVLVYCGYIGGAHLGYGRDVAVDAQGNAYIVGDTNSHQSTFPVKVGPDLTYNDMGGSAYSDVFVAKVNPAGNGLVYCGFIGGTGLDAGYSIAVDTGGAAYVAGYTGSLEKSFPVQVGPDLTHNGAYDAFIAKVNPLGTGLSYCGYVGGVNDDKGFGVAVDPQGNAYVSGSTASTETTFPVRIGPDLTYNGSYSDAFVVKVTPSGSTLAYCGYIGGLYADDCADVAVDTAGNAFVVGSTQSSEATFPVRVGPDLTKNCPWVTCQDAFVAKVNVAGSGLVYCGYIGGLHNDFGLGIDLDEFTNAYACGTTESDQTTFPVRTGPDLTFNGRGQCDGFVAKVNVAGTSLVYCGYIGGNNCDGAEKIAVDLSRRAHVIGGTNSDEKTFPVRGGPDLSYNGGGYDAFVARVNVGGTALDSCGYVGGSSGEIPGGIDVDRAGNAFVSGTTWSTESTFPVLIGPDLTHNGLGDPFVAKVANNGLGGGSPTPRIGTTVTLALVATADAGLAYQVGSSLGTGPIVLGTRRLGLSPDDLLRVSVQGLLPGIFVSYTGRLDATGRANANIRIPAVKALVGVRIHSAFVTLSAIAPLGIKSISNTFSFSITK